MLYLDRHRAFVNMWMLATHWRRPSGPTVLGAGPGRLKTDYIEAYNRTHGTAIPVLEHGIHVELARDDLLSRLVDGSMFRPDDVARDGYAFDVSQQKIIRANIAGALELLGSLDPGLIALLDTVVATIACVRVRRWRGGSASQLPGLVVVSPQPEWTIVTYASYLLHETIHQCLFLEDRARGLFRRGADLEARDARVYSALRRTRRPLDMTVHAACVAVGLMYFHHLCGAREREQTYLRQLRKSVGGIISTERKLREKGRAYLTENGDRLLDELRAFCADPRYDFIVRAVQAGPASEVGRAIAGDGASRALVRL
jgi:hypothetical protein